jgi:predicted nucleotidyltransferase component of viral defense system
MAFAENYKRQVGLLIRTLPLVAEQKCFALKGGTAINLFVRDMPRLSVDIDLTYLPVRPRAESLAAIDAAMKRIAGRITQSIPGAKITEGKLEDALTRLLVRAEGVQTKIEVTPVLRGCVYEPELRGVSEAVEDAFGFAEIQVVSFADLYAGKIVAALDRQHPRDLFDVRGLLANEGIDDNLRRAFVVYMHAQS